MHNFSEGKREGEMPYKLNTQAKDITDNRYYLDEAYDYECTHDYNRLHIYFICNNYKCQCLQEAKKQKKSKEDKIYMYCNGEVIGI